MMPRSPNPKRGITRTEIVVILVLLVLCGGVFGFWPGAVVLILLFGWIVYPFQVAGDITIEPMAVFTSLLALVLFTWGVSSFGKWLARETSTEEHPRTWTLKQSFQFVALILFAFVAGTSMIGIVHQVTWMATTDEGFFQPHRSRSHGFNSKTNLKIIGLAQHNYHDYHQQFATSTFAKDGSAWHSLQTYLLPYADEARLYDQIDLDVPWSHPDNAELFRKEIPVYLNPGIDNKPNPDQLAPSHYASNIRVLSPNRNVSFKEIPDGSSTTILMGEVPSNFKAWADPTNLRDPARRINQSPSGFGSPFEGGVHFLFADGTIRFISESIDPKVLKALATPRGGEEIDDDAY